MIVILRKEHLEAELAAIRSAWQAQMESSLKAVAEETLGRLKRDSEQVEKEVASRVGGMEKTFAGTAAEAETKLGSLSATLNQQDERSRDTLSQCNSAEQRVSDRAGKLAEAAAEAESKLAELREYINVQNERLQDSLRQLQATEGRISEQLVKLDLLARAAGQDLEHRSAALLESARDDIARHADGATAASTQRLRTIQEAALREIDRLTNQTKAELNSGLNGAGEMLRNIERAGAEARESVRSAQENITRTSEQTVDAAVERIHSFIGNLERQIEESGSAATAKSIAEIENKTTEATHTTFESLVKASEWYEKKFHTQVQNVMERGLEETAHKLRERAEAAVGEFCMNADAAAGQRAMQLETQTARILAEGEAEGREFLSQMRAALTQDVQVTLARANEDLHIQVRHVHEAAQREAGAQENRLSEAMSEMSGQAIQAYERRLEDVANLLLLNLVSKFTRDSDAHLEMLIDSAEQRLRQTCSGIFAEIGEALRQGFLELTLNRPPAGNPGAGASQDENSSTAHAASG
jgi:hypothetical protein